MKRPSCGSCPHYVTTPILGQGECHFYPPKVFCFITPNGPITPAAWPPVQSDTPGCYAHPQIGTDGPATRPVQITRN